jgi:hypothetical protein
MATPTNLPASFTAGNVLTAAQMNDLRGAFRVLQVVYGSAGTQQVSSSSTLADTTLTATITPQSNTSKVLVLVAQNGVHKSTGNTSVKLVLLRDATQIALIGEELADTNSTLEQSIGTAGLMILDSPATTSAVTYKTRFSSVANTSFAVVQHFNALSTIVLMEISA